MSGAYILDKVLNSSLLILFFYTCFATLILCLAYLLEEEVKKLVRTKRERRTIRRQSAGPVDAVVDDIYDSY